MGRQVVGSGPGTLRVGRFIGRLGVVSLPAIEAGLDLDRACGSAACGEARGGGVARSGAVGLGRGLRGLADEPRDRAAQASAVCVPSRRRLRRRRSRTVSSWAGRRRVPRSAAGCGSRRASSRVDPDRWAVRMRCERGSTKQLPDLAVWLARSGPPIALVAESGGRREDRQKMILEGWRDAILAGQYAAVLYDCASESVARWISRLAKKARLTRSEFTAVVQPRARGDRRPHPRRRRR